MIQIDFFLNSNRKFFVFRYIFISTHETIETKLSKRKMQAFLSLLSFSLFMKRKF